MGAVAVEMMDLIVNPASQAVTVNPESPYIPTLDQRHRIDRY